MRVLLVADAGSIHTKRWTLALSDRGHDVEVATLRDGECEGATVHLLPTGGLGKVGYLLAIPALRKLISSVRPDVINAHYATSYGFIAAAAGFHPLIVTAWGSDVLFHKGGRRVARTLTRRALQEADLVTTVAEHMNVRVRDIGGAAIEVTAIPFGVDSNVFKYRRGESASDCLRIVCTRNFHPLYDVESVVRAFGILRASTHARLILIGDGPERGSLERLVDALGIRQDVDFKGHLEPKDLGAELALAQVFVSPAHSDGNNVSLNEAMAVECFPVATDIPANRQWIEDGKTGLLFRAGDASALASALMSAWEDSARRREASLINRTIVEARADWSRGVDAMVALYGRVMANREVHV